MVGSRNLFASSLIVFSIACSIQFSGCGAGSGGSGPSSNPPPVNSISVTVSPTSQSVQTDLGSQSFTATVKNDSQNAGVNWTISGSGCSGTSCGTLSASSSASGSPVTYQAPHNTPSPATVTLTATSAADKTQAADAVITLTPAVSVLVSAVTSSLPLNMTTQVSAAVTNDSQNKGVTWAMTIGGNACTQALCGSLSSASSSSGASITYTPPSSLPLSSILIAATSVTDPNESGSVAMSVTPLIAVSVDPPFIPGSPPVPIYYSTFADNSYPVQAGQAEDFVASLQNDVNNAGVTWAISSPSCAGSACGSLTNSTSSGVTYNAPPPSSVPANQAPISVTLTATSIADPAQSASLTIPVSNGIPSQTGWFEIPKTLLRPACSTVVEIQGTDGCQAVISAWNGAIADTANQRLLIMGGGHDNYSGNELYSVDLNSSSSTYLTLRELTNPVFPTPIPSCTEDWGTPPTMSAPSARENYGDLAAINGGGSNQLWLFGGALANSGCRSSGMWILDIPTLTWTRMDTTLKTSNLPSSAPITLGSTFTDINYSDYDLNSNLVYTYLSDADVLASYDPGTNTLTSLASGKLSGQIGGANFRANGVLDPVRHIFLIVGQGTVAWFDLNSNPPVAKNFSLQAAAAGCKPSPDPNNPAIEDAISPGLAFDPVQDRVVGWAGGNTVWLIDTTSTTAATPSLSCTTLTFPGGPPPAPIPGGGGTSGEQKNGTFGRFRYFPGLNLFVLVNDWEQNAFTLRLNP
jgi:hypothetical protein